MIELSIIIVSWNVANHLRDCLKSVQIASAGIDGVEVIVVDNDSSDCTVAMLEKEFPLVSLIRNDFNAGFAGGNNQGIHRASGRVILLLNPDTIVEPDTLRKCMAEIQRRPDVGALGCKIFFPTGEIQVESARNFPSLMSQFFDAMYLHMLFPKNRLFGRTNMTYWDHHDSRYIPCITGAFMFIRREVFDDVGVFDPAVPMYLDDIDLCFRIQKAGWRIFYFSSAAIVHKGGCSETQTTRVLDPIAAEARYVFFLKHYGLGVALGYRAIAVWQSVFRLAVAVIAAPLRLVHPTAAISRATHVRRHLALLYWAVAHPN